MVTVGNQTLAPETWLDRHGDVLFIYAVARLRDHSIAEEMVQETLLAAIQSSNRFASQERTWLIGILKHKIVDHYRKTSRQSRFDASRERELERDELFQQTGEWAGHWDFETGPGEWRDGPAIDLWSAVSSGKL